MEASALAAMPFAFALDVQMVPGGCPVADECVGRPQRVMRLQEERRILSALSQAEQLLSLIQSRPDLPARDMEEEESP